jgi:DNA processing protein
MARGIDTSAHRAALNNGGKTIAVFGCGIDVIYPAENRKLAGQIAQEGLILSEFAMGTPGHPQNFPVRNRVISGLSAGVLVVEGAQYSGSAITARMAMEQNRPVFAVPGNITSKMSWGTNLLIKEGAKLVQAAEDVVTELSIEDRQAAAGQSKLPFDESPSPEQQLEQVLGPAAHIGKAVLKELQVDQPVHLDELIERSANASPSELIAALFQLEMIQLVRQLPGRNYVRVW